MTRQQFWQGMGLGILAGTIVGISVTPHRKNMKGKAGKALRAVGGAMENLSEGIGK